jgi:hypothetical protein
MSLESSSVRKSRHVAPAELDRLELTIHRLLDAHDAWRERAIAAESRVAELDAALDGLKTGKLDPVALSDEVRTLEERNLALRDRLQRADETVQRILARLQFAEEVR